jgi:hypothetical protein
MTSRRNTLVGRSVIALLFTVLWQLPSSAVHAHSAPGVAAIVDEDAHGIYVLRLYAGHAQHAHDGWHYYCSGLYQGQGSEISASLPGGGVAIATARGIWVLDRDGTIGPHPDPEAQGFVTAFARGGGRLYGIKQRTNDTVYDLIEVTADAVRVLWTDTRYWNDLAVGDTLIQLVRIDGDTIEALQLSLEGKALGAQDAPLADVQAVNARMVGDAAYYTVRLETSAELGHIQQNAWHVLQMAANSIAGPSRTADGISFVAVDGKLATFDADVLASRDDTDFVTGLNRLDNHSYACTSTGLRDLSSAGLGELVFDLSQLLPPDPCVVPVYMRPACELEWQHLQSELLGSNIPIAQVRAPSQCSADAGLTGVVGAPPPLAADGGIARATADSGAPALDGGRASESGTETSQPSLSSPAHDGGGCIVASSARRTPAAWFVLFACFYARRFRRVARFTAPPHD